ncbi:hypothetical protein [Streptomyces sp. NBC_00207]|uniref:hypothetical protein n=1 Tax=unclassified Streptomyces TaxID=2593676 RepID=UPI002884C825|nr:hypothetical protein [Streptomyces sp. DSM 41633]
MTAHPITAAQAAALLRQIAQATEDPNRAYAYPAEAAATAEALAEAADQLRAASKRLDRYVRAHRHSDDWRSTDRETPRHWTDEAAVQAENATHHARQTQARLSNTAEALRHLAPN